jgi:hypothetical protein
VSVSLDLTGVQPGPISVVRGDDSVTVTWPDETARAWRATSAARPSRGEPKRTAGNGRVAVWDVAGNGALVNPFWRP